MAVHRDDYHAAAAPALVAAALRDELREWRESVLPSALRSAGVLQVTGDVDERAFVLRYHSVSVRRRTPDDVELRGRLVDSASGGTVVSTAVHHSNGLVTMVAVWIALLVVIGWFSLEGAFVCALFGSMVALHAWWRAQARGARSAAAPLSRRAPRARASSGRIRDFELDERLHDMRLHALRLLLAFALVACTRHVAPPPGQPAGLRYTPPRAAPWTPRGTLIVQVVTHEDGSRVAGADVHLSPDTGAVADAPGEWDQGAIYAVAADSTAATGEFLLRRWPRGTYLLTAKHVSFGAVREWVRICGGRQDTVVVRLRGAGCDLQCQGMPRTSRRLAPCGRRVID
jgi:hypothetical protein